MLLTCAGVSALLHRTPRGARAGYLKEYLVLVEALEKDAIAPNVEDFYYLSRAALVKDERHLDKFDRVFGHVFKGLEKTDEAINAEIPAEWLQSC